jgi:hypothetical protein
MKNLWQPECVEELKDRLAKLRPDTPRLWGKMTPGQAVAHCAIGMELALGDRRPPRMLIGRLIGSAIKKKAFQEGPLRRRRSRTLHPSSPSLLRPPHLRRVVHVDVQTHRPPPPAIRRIGQSRVFRPLKIALREGAITINPFPLLLGRRTVTGWSSGTGMDSEDTLKFGALTCVR